MPSSGATCASSSRSPIFNFLASVLGPPSLGSTSTCTFSRLVAAKQTLQVGVSVGLWNLAQGADLVLHKAVPHLLYEAFPETTLNKGTNVLELVMAPCRKKRSQIRLSIDKSCTACLMIDKL